MQTTIFDDGSHILLRHLINLTNVFDLAHVPPADIRPRILLLPVLVLLPPPLPPHPHPHHYHHHHPHPVLVAPTLWPSSPPSPALLSDT